MARYPHKLQALVDYAGGIGVAWLRDPSGRLVASSCFLEPQESALPDEALAVRLARELPRAPGLACTEAGTHMVKFGGYMMTILSTAGIAPSAVRTRLEGCRRLLRAMGEANVPWPPTGGGAGGSSPASAELRVWPPRRPRASS